MWLFNLFKRNKGNNEFDRLNDTCNTTFEGIFNKCRLDFGREMVEIMDMKSKLLDVVKSTNASTPAQNLIAKKFLELIPVYFKVIGIYVSAKRDNHLEKNGLQALEEMEEKTKRVYSLINNLSSQFYLCSNEMSGLSACDDIINEAEALRNVINDNEL